MNLRFLSSKSCLRPAATPVSEPLTLDRVQPGRSVLLQDLSLLEPAQQAHLRAYGMAPGRAVRVIQHAPETVVQVEFTELAFEKEMACKIVVTLR